GQPRHLRPRRPPVHELGLRQRPPVPARRVRRGAPPQRPLVRPHPDPARVDGGVRMTAPVTLTQAHDYVERKMDDFDIDPDEYNRADERLVAFFGFFTAGFSSEGFELYWSRVVYTYMTGRLPSEVLR